MTSHYGSTEAQTSVIKNCTVASTFVKQNSLKFELLFGDYCRNLPMVPEDKAIIEAVDYQFLPGQIFGFAYESFGVDFKKFHHGFVLRACRGGEVGCMVPGINPGAEILVKTFGGVMTNRFKEILQVLAQNQVDLTAITGSQYRRLNDLLETKSSTVFLVGELKEAYNSGIR